MHHIQSLHHKQRGAAATLVLIGFAAVALFFMLTEHRAHLYGWLPFVLLAACPLMHLFHGHGGHAGHKAHGADPTPERADPPPPTSAVSQPVAAETEARGRPR
ncbi:MAG: DUF2933 domain-containing protein [Stagnimonas sp.]|jgi:hypothetical protein|nr:DUF2933 domain-containing protein [Stagnimonas sp.]